MSRQRYLGDSVYVELDDGDVKLTTNNGYGDTNTIYLEESVINQLLKWLKEIVVDSNKAAGDDS